MKVNFVKLFKQGSWLRSAQNFVNSKSKLAALAMEAVNYVREKQSLGDIKDDVTLLCAYVRDVAKGNYKGYSKKNLTIIVAALIYVISPIDIIPDFLVGGFLDDVGIVAWAMSKVGKELTSYRLARASFQSPESSDPDELTEADFDVIS